MASTYRSPGRTKGKLSEAQRAFVVREIAAFSTPLEIVKLVKEQFGIDIIKQSIEHYDPTKNPGLSRKWKGHFEACRKAFRERIEDEIPLANKFVRVRELSRITELMDRRGNHLAQAQMLEQIAKEVGNVHTNKREFTGKDGGPMEVKDVSDMTPEQVNDELRIALNDPATRAFLLSLTSNQAPAIPPSPQKETKRHG